MAGLSSNPIHATVDVIMINRHLTYCAFMGCLKRPKVENEALAEIASGVTVRLFMCDECMKRLRDIPVERHKAGLMMLYE